MSPSPEKKSLNFRITPFFFLILCLACLAVSADAAPLASGLPVQAATVTTAPVITCGAPCECLESSAATAKWGASGFTQCAEKACGYGYTVTTDFAPLNKRFTGPPHNSTSFEPECKFHSVSASITHTPLKFPRGCFIFCEKLTFASHNNPKFHSVDSLSVSQQTQV